MPASLRGKFPWLLAEIRRHPCAACAGQQGAVPRCRYAPSTALTSRVRPRENRFRSPDTQRRTASEDHVLSPANHQSHHPRLAKLVWPCSAPVLEKEMITDFLAVWT